MIGFKQDGIPIVGFTWYSLTDQMDWDSALPRKRRPCEPLGLFDLDGKSRPVGQAYRPADRQRWRDALSGRGPRPEFYPGDRGREGDGAIPIQGKVAGSKMEDDPPCDPPIENRAAIMPADPDASPLAGLRVAAFETRISGPMADLIRKHGGTPVEAPALREIPIGQNDRAVAFARGLIAGEFDVVIFLTGVGSRYLLQEIEAEVDPARPSSTPWPA